MRYEEGLHKIQGKWDQLLSYKVRFKIAGRNFLKLLDLDSSLNRHECIRPIFCNNMVFNIIFSLSSLVKESNLYPPCGALSVQCFRIVIQCKL